ncbi:hypothetical protein IFM89_035125 [Coptis chinensis]|uniref:NIF system FeS cluster assembly NifU N-terminal domain-containing protein n=1 Tax=Coptis chinensis TaxID=261450 RepID=A0A835IV89_9MAGN|nr:hypothetical protein IFM89_035125 [Coptis chinensis]
MLRTNCKKFLGLGQQLQKKNPAGIRLYHERVVDHYNNPRNVGSFDKNDPKVGTGLVGAPACGDVMKLQIKVDDEGKIVDACFKTFGCGSAIASSSVATEWVKGKQMEEVLTIKNTRYYIAGLLDTIDILIAKLYGPAMDGDAKAHSPILSKEYRRKPWLEESILEFQLLKRELPPSSSGLGHLFFKEAAGIRLPLGVLRKEVDQEV